jgi:hypothetical protein
VRTSELRSRPNLFTCCKTLGCSQIVVHPPPSSGDRWTKIDRNCLLACWRIALCHTRCV